MTIDIIGAGIGGLTTAVALEQKGYNVNLYEQAKTIRPVGAGIVLANNAMQVYEKLGLRKQLEAAGNRISAIQLTTSDLKVLSTMDMAYFEEKYQVNNIAIHRAELQQILVQALKKDTLKLGYQLKDIKQTPTDLKLSFQNSEVLPSSLVIAADGQNSIIRNQLFSENKLRNARQICWRGIVDYILPKEYQHLLTEAWGKGDRIGFVQISPNKVYWFALKSFKKTTDEFPLEQLNSFFNHFHPLAKELLKATPIENIHTSEMMDLYPIKNWYKPNICLLGDAAHATTPNMGQGAGQSIEDAWILAECLHKYEPTKAFETYQGLRMKKAHHVVNTSWTLGKVAHLSNPIFISLRNQLMKWTPASVNRKQSERIIELASV